jgi:hypothetical protein
LTWNGGEGFGPPSFRGEEHMKKIDVRYADGSTEHCLADSTDGDVVDINTDLGTVVIRAVDNHFHFLNWNYVARLSTSDHKEP